MVLMPLAVVENWQAAINARDLEQLAALAAHDIEICVGPRVPCGTSSAQGGAGLACARCGADHSASVGARCADTLHGWLVRAGFTAETLRWFCGANGDVVIEQRARWSLPDALLADERTIASVFRVRGGRVVRYGRYDDLASALAAVHLTDDDEVIHHA